MKFGEAIELVKQGKLVSRQGWNGKNMFIFQRPEDTLPAQMVVEKVKSLPESVRMYYDNLYKRDYQTASGSTFTIKFTSYLCMKAVDDSIVNGWLASQTDMLAEDWVEYK